MIRLLSPRRRPVVKGRAAGRRRSAAPGAPAAWVPASLPGWCEAGTLHTPGRLPRGRASRPAAARLPDLPAAGPTHLPGRATVPLGGPL